MVVVVSERGMVTTVVLELTVFVTVEVGVDAVSVFVFAVTVFVL